MYNCIFELMIYSRNLKIISNKRIEIFKTKNLFSKIKMRINFVDINRKKNVFVL
jgi:hypothetical protein